MRRKRKHPRRASQAPQTPPSPPWASILRPRPFSDQEWEVFQQQAPGYTGLAVPASPADQAVAKRFGELLEQYAQEHRRWIEAENARSAAEEAARREAVEREARRRRRRRAAKRAAKGKAANREAARIIVEQSAAAERKAAKQKTSRLPQRSDAQRVAMTQDDIAWARTKLQDDFKKAYCGVDAAYSTFKIEWGKDPTRSKQKVPSRTQYLKKVWKRRASDQRLATKQIATND